MCSGILNYNDNDGSLDMLPLLKRILSNDQDSVVPLIGSRTLVRELAHDLKYKATVPYAAWFHKGQVGGWATEYGNLLTFATLTYGTLCTDIKGFAPLQFIYSTKLSMGG
ncbi:hypothetical protein SOVF_212980 [Spinacia oleracea]|nr:hypothetical protein SOVF_212980 [Spinacia oleracea]